MDRQERRLAYVLNKFCLFIYCFWKQVWSWSWSTGLHLAIRCFLQIEHKSIVSRGRVFCNIQEVYFGRWMWYHYVRICAHSNER
jgi:hypothetical protein